MDAGRWVTAILLATVLGACREAESPAGPEPPRGAVTGGTLSSDVTPEVFSGAGNIGDCGSTSDEATGNLLDGLAGTVFTLGDNAFPHGAATDYANCYDPAWGRHKARTWATLGNHDYDSGNAAAAFSYWGSRVGTNGTGYYSVNIGSWHVIVLNDAGKYTATNVYSPWANGSPQEQWLRADLAANTQACTLAMWHVPLFLSSNDAGYTENSEHRNLWNDLYAAQVDVVLNGQQHDYERMAPMRPDGTRDDAAGIRQFNVGTGGGDGVVLPTVAIHPNSEVRAAAFGRRSSIPAPRSATGPSRPATDRRWRTPAGPTRPRPGRCNSMGAAPATRTATWRSPTPGLSATGAPAPGRSRATPTPPTGATPSPSS